jgi:hypothetical protein
MLILPENTHRELREKHEDAKSGLTSHFNTQLEKILNENKQHDLYWVLGKVKFPQNGSEAKVFLQACLEKPPLISHSFLYEVDSRKGTKTLLWVLYPNGSLSLPTLKKTISVGSQSKKSKRVK